MGRGWVKKSEESGFDCMVMSAILTLLTLLMNTIDLKRSLFLVYLEVFMLRF